MSPKVAFVVLSAFPLRAVAQSTLEWPNALFRAVLALPKGSLGLVYVTFSPSSEYRIVQVRLFVHYSPNDYFVKTAILPFCI